MASNIPRAREKLEDMRRQINLIENILHVMRIELSDALDNMTRSSPARRGPRKSKPRASLDPDTVKAVVVANPDKLLREIGQEYFDVDGGRISEIINPGDQP